MTANRPYNNAVITTAHSVRTLRCCADCRGLGNVESMLRIPRRGRTAKDIPLLHGRCYIRRYGIRRFLALPQKLTNNLLLSDIGVKVARSLLEMTLPKPRRR